MRAETGQAKICNQNDSTLMFRSDVDGHVVYFEKVNENWLLKNHGINSILYGTCFVEEKTYVRI